MTEARTPLASARDLIDYAHTLDCIHCGLCLQTCPTFRLSGSEASSPRGRIHLMRAVAEAQLEATRSFADEMDFCLLCRHCESVCPAGVRFGEMMETTRAGLRIGPWHRRGLAWLGFRIVLPSRVMLKLCALGLRLLQLARIDRWFAGLRHLPRIQPLRATRRMPGHTPAATAARGRVDVLHGCVLPELFPQVSQATVESLATLGHSVRVPHAVVCCGSLHAHNGDLEGARALVRRAIEAFEPGSREATPIVVNSAGCGSHLKECAQLFAEDDPWKERALAFAGRVRDYAEFVSDAIAGSTAPASAALGRLATAPDVGSRVAWDDPCHLCHGQGIRDEPRRILDALDGIEPVELEDSESCCGSAGLWALSHPEEAARLFEKKRQAFERTGAEVLVTSNPGCQLQWSSGLKAAGSTARVVHLAELVRAAQREGQDL